MKGYLITYKDDIDCVTNNPKKWLEENNKLRLKDNMDIESLDIFTIVETELCIYEVSK